MPKKAKTVIKKWMWEMNLGNQAGLKLWCEAIKQKLSNEQILTRILRHGVKMKMATLRKIMNGRCDEINQLQPVALALGLKLSQVLQLCELDGSPEDMVKKLAKLLHVKPVKLPPRKLSAKDKKFYDQAHKDLNKQLKQIDAAEKSEGKLRKMKSSKKK